MTAALKAVPGVRERVSPEEWALRVDLAAAFRLAALNGWDDLIFTHMSVRIPGPEHHFLINSYTNMFEEVTASNLVKIDLNGDKVMDCAGQVIRAGFVIHSAIHSARENANAVIHLHTPQGQAVSASADGLLPVTQTAMIVCHDVAYHESEGIAEDMGEQERIVADLGEKNTMILRNHGTMAVGETIQQAYLRMYFLERACQAQVLIPGKVHRPQQGVAEVIKGQVTGPATKMIAEHFAWPALLRKLDRIDSSFRD
ncbi:class II aldolase/adducin family protein [Caulobacter soli]|uniref:class II aldolase/adducin family protein n=1 Tax=Caulobacter soli TaxID=2708539 RepID=UPI0013EDDEE6|nr:class II aldolase/adducin family protein [Caulobacter soli]